MLLSDAITVFLADRRAKGYAQGTVRNEANALRNLLADVGNIDTRRIRPQHIDTFYSKHTDWAEGTLNRMRTHLQTFFDWLVARGHMRRDLDLMAGTRKLRVPQRSRIIIPQAKFTTLLDSAKDPRTRAAVAIGLYLFTRISETQDLRWQDVRFEDGEVDVYRRKTRSMDTLPLCDELAHELKRWRLAYAAKVGEEIQPGWYVIPRSSAPLRYGQKGVKGFTTSVTARYSPTLPAKLSNTIKCVLEEAGYYQPHEGGHTLRRSGATALYNQLTSVGHDRAIRIVQAMLGHSSVTTTELYLRLDLDRKVRNDVLKGKPMFPAESDAQVLDIKGAISGAEDSHQVRM